MMLFTCAWGCSSIGASQRSLRDSHLNRLLLAPSAQLPLTYRRLLADGRSPRKTAFIRYLVFASDEILFQKPYDHWCPVDPVSSADSPHRLSESQEAEDWNDILSASMTTAGAVYLVSMTVRESGAGHCRGPVVMYVRQSDTFTIAVAHRLGNWAHKPRNRRLQGGIGLEHAWCEENSLQTKKRSTCANSAGSLGGEIRRRRQQGPSRCTMIFSYLLSCVLERAQCVRRQRATCVDRQRPEAGLTAGLRSWRNLNHNRLTERCKKSGAALRGLVSFYLDVAAGGRSNGVAKRSIAMKPEGYCIALAMVARFSGRSRISERKKKAQSRTILHWRSPRATSGRTWEMFSEAGLCQRLDTIVQIQALVEC